MSNIDFSQAVTAEAKAAASAAERAAMAKAECRRRILAVCDETAQINLATAAAAGALSGDQMQTFQEWRNWVNSMRAACTTGVDWPDLPAGVAELARF